MAERPLYTLYKNLKAQNYDVPDDYNKFESALTRDGKSGADNRHAIYENLKAQNFDVPSTYERFYSALFVPRSRTSSRAKGGSVPMSAADRARYLSVTQSVLNTARQVKRASGNIRKTVERAKKFNANGGKVTIGFKNPLQNKNVQKNEFNYNSTTGKTGTYTTTDGVEFDNEYDASQYQNQLDKYGEEWNNAVDMGIVPSELDKADPDLSDTDVAMRQMERRQEWLNENQDRRSKELNESMHLQGSPFVASGGAVAPSSFNTAISNEANRLSDVEYGAYNTAKAYNQMLRTTLLQELKEQKQRNENAGWWKDKWNDVSNYFGAMFNTMLDPKLYSQGVMDAAISNNLLQVKKGMEDGTIKKGSNAGNAAQAMLGAIQQQQGEAAKQQQYGTKAYQYGDVSGRSLKFMGDFALSGWRNVMTTGFTKTGEKVGEKMALGALGKWFTKNTGRMLGDMAGSAALAATNQLGSTYNNVIERYVGMNNENGGVTQDKNGDLKFNEGVSLGKAIKDGFGSATIENFSEMFGEYLPGASKLLSKLGLSKVSSFFEKIGNNAYYKWLSNATNKSGIQGVMAEISEEEFGTALHAAWGDGDGSWSDFNVFTNPDAREKQIDTCLGMFYSVGFMQAPRTAVGAINAVQYFKIKHQVNKADKFGQWLFNDNWDEIKSKIDVSTNADLTKTVLDATRSDSMTAKQKGAVINYAMFLSKLRGFNQASDAKTKDKVEEGDTAPTLSNDLDDAYTEGHNADDADKHDIQIQQEDQMKTLAAAFGISEQQLSAMSDEELESLTGQDDKLDQAIYDYQLSSARYQGVIDDAQDKVDIAAHQAAQKVDMYTDRSRGSVRNATIKASGGLEDYGVYIISGNIATHEDGSIDVSNSDDMILYYDPTTNSVEHADALMFAELGEELPADDVKAQAVADAKENAIKEIAGIIDGTVEVGSQFNVTDTDGIEHTYEVLADYGDGTAAVSIDGNVVENPYSLADLQQMKDLEDQKRLEAAKAQREQLEKERADQQTQETEETQPSFDFNQILNDNGNVVLVDVLDEDGNTKYPDSKLFLIRDTGAKAKVVELKSDGTIVPHAVNKEDVATISSMSLDEYKQAFAASSMIEDNSGENRGEIEVESPTIEDETTPEVAENTETTAPSDETTETPATEQTPAAPTITLEDGTIVPMLEDGNPDFSKLTAAQTAELYDNQFGEDADSIVSGYVSDAKKALDKANNMTVKGKTFLEQKASKDAKEKAIADAQAAYDSAIAIRDAYNERQLAKVEDTAEGRKNLIEKARRKFARLKSAVKDDAEAVAQIYKETVGTLLHRLYDGTGIDVTDTIPLTAEEYVASNLGAHSLNYEGTETSKGVKQETGLSREDFAKTQLLAADGKGTTIDALVHSLWDNRPSNLESLDTQDIRNALIDVLTSGFKASEARSFIENIRIAQAEKLIEEERTAAENAAYYEQQKAKEEEEKKKAELEKKAEEEKKKAEENIDLPAIDKQGEPINNNIIELAKWAKKQGLEIDPTSKLNSYADLFLMCKDGFGVSTLVPDEGKNINQVIYFPDNAEVVEQLGKLQEEFNAGRDLNHSSNIDSEITEGATFYDAATAKEFRDFVNEQTKFPDTLREGSNAIEAPEDATDEKPLGEQLDESDLPFSAKENGKQQTTAERAADVEKNKVDDMKVVDNIVGQKTRKAFERLAKMMGANIQWQYSDKLGNGWIQETKDADGNVHRTIFITLDSSITEGAQFIFGHEMTHQIKSLNPAAYNELTQLVLDTYGSDAFDKAVDETMLRYPDAGFSGRARDYYAEEVVADAVGEMIRDLNLAHTLAMKMSHPLLAAIHEILQKIKLAFFGTEYSDVTKNIIRSIEQAYVKTAKGEVTNSETGEDVSFSLRQKPEPKKKGVGYKVFVLKDGKLYPPMVANPDGAATPVGVWLDADAAPIAGESKTGRPQVKQGGKGTQGGSGKLAYRPGWHLGVVPYAIQFNRKDAEGNKTLFPKNFVFAEVEYAADVDYQEEARQEGINPSGKYQHSLAGLKHLPTDGYYMYRTNPNPETDPWVITGAMKVNRILTRAEQADLVSKAGREPQQIQEGDIVTDDVVNSINQEIADAPKFSIKTYHGSQASFDKFDHSFMGSGEGAQAYGWGTYVSEVEGIAKAYAKQNAKKNAPSRLMYQDKPMTYKTPSIIYQVAFNMDKFNISAKEAISQMIDAGEKKLASVDDTPFAKMKAKQVQDELNVLKGLNPSDFKINEDYDTVAQNLADTKSGLDLLEDELKDAKSYVDLYQSRLDEAKGELSKAKESGTGLGVDMYESDVMYYSEQVEKYKQNVKTKESDIKDVKTKIDALQKKLDSIGKPRNLYSVDIPDDTGDNYIGWDEPITPKMLEAKRRVMEEDGYTMYDSDGNYDYFEKTENGKYQYWQLWNRQKGNGLYSELSKVLHSDKLASLALNKQGIVGVKVIADRTTGGNKEGKMNYVIFDENNAQITNHTKFSLRLKSAIEETETNPSDAQKESGNYKKGHIKFGGYDYTIENPKGSTRSGKDANGKEWKVTMHDTYGYIRGKFGKDGDHLDMFINDKADLDNWDGDVFVVDQVNPDGSFDEHKVMYGYDSMDDAEKAYLANYSKGWKGLGNITGVSKDEFDKWLDTSKRKLKPFKDYAKVKFSLKDNQGNPLNQDGTLKLDKIKSVDELTDEDFLHPTRNVELPSLPKKIADAIGTEGKPVVIKKNIFERNYMRHKDVTPELSKVIFKSALYNPDLYGQNQKKTRPYNWVLINTKDEKGNNRTVLLEVNPNKDNVEIVHWHFVNDKNLGLIKKQAIREGDQVLILPSEQSEEVGGLSNLTDDLSAAKIDNSSETAKENGEKFSLKDEKTLAGVHNITEEKLRKALKLGGFANPSLAVIDTNKSGHDNFGEISFIAPSALVDKRTGKTAGTWITDAYTQRYPSVERQMSEKGSQKFEDWVDSLEYPSAAKAEIKRQTKDVMEDNGVPAWELMYLKEKGIDIKAYDSRIDYRWKEIINDHPTAEDILSSMQNDPELNEKVTSLAKHAIIHPTWEKVSLEVRRKMYKETGVKASPINPQVRKQTKEIFERDYKSTLLNKDGSPRKKDVKKVVEDIVKEHNDTKKYDFYLSKVKASNYVNKNGLYDDYIRWQENKLDEFGTKNRIFRGYTKDGSRKYVPETLENVSKAMREEADGQTNGSEYTSFGSFIAKLASRVDSTDEMRANKDKLSSNEDKEAFYEKWSEVYYDLAKFLYNDVFYGEQRLHDIVLQSDPKKYAKKEYGITLTPTFMKKLDALKNAVQTELKSAYFETKYNRPLRLNEFAAAVVPDNLGEDVRKGIEDAGLPMYDYDPNKEGDRSRAFNEAINSSDNIRFSLKAEKEKIVADAKSNGTYMTAPNGEKTKLDAEQWATVRTANFKNWFGDWENDPENASKVVDENGEPMVMYHYTDESFTIFGKDKEVGKNTFGNATNASYAATTTIGHWFTSNKKQPEYMGKPMACFLNIVEPFDGYTLEGLADYLNNYISDEDFNSYEEDYENVAPIIEAGNNFREEQIRDGYDGVVIDDEEFGGTSYVAFNANQIKSAENNNGDFSADNNDIRFSLAGERGAAAADKAEERTARMDFLSVARKMEEEKKDAKAIKMATGWERGADGKWRYEMPDAKIKDTMDVGGGQIVKRYEEDMLWNGGKLSKVIDAPELFKAYPQLKDVRIETDAIMNDMPSNGEYNAKTNTITIHADELKYMNSILNHEIQHAIQSIEGFDRGGSPRLVRGEIKKRLAEVTKQIRQLRAEGKEDEAKAIVEKNRGLYNAYQANDDYNSYKSLAGEVEARNVSARINMTPEERRKTLAESTEDVARKDQIFLGVGDVSFSLRDMADGKESGAADMAEDLKSLNTPDEVDDAIKTAIDDMPSGWQMANRKMIHIAQALGENRKAEIAGEEPKFSLKDGTLIKAGTYFSGGGLVEEGLKGIIDPVVAVEYDEKISGVYRNNFGQHIVTADVRDVDPKELVKQIDGEVEYFHASPVCKNYSQAKSNHAELELDKETAASTAEFINAIKPKVVTIENVKGYKDSEAMKTITDALDANGYTWDADVYNAADYGGYTNRERLIVRAVRDGKLPDKPKKMAHKSGWYEAVADIIPTLTEKKNGVAPWMDVRLKADGIDWRNIDKPLYVMGSAYADGKIPHAFADELLPTLRTKSGDVIVMPDGKVYRAMGRVLARVSGVSDDYKMPFSENLSHTIIGNGIPTQLTEHVIAPLLTGSDPKFSIRTYHGTGASFDKFDFSHMGEGEGSQAFGWGGYVTNSKDIAEDYTRRAKIRKDNGGFEFVTDMSANNKDMVRQYIYKYKDVNKGLDAMRKDLPSALEMFPDDDDLKELSNILAKKNEEIAVPDNIAYLYDVDIPDDNGDYLDWDAPLTDKQKNTIIKELRRLKIDFDDFKKRGFSFDGSFGGNAYDFLMYALRRTKKWKDVDASRAVSKFLSSIGFTGIKYKAGNIFGGAKEGDYNYVIFDENNANIVGNTRFSLRYDQFEHDLNQWKKDNNLPKDAKRPSIPQRNAGESAVDFLRRVDDYRKQMALWKTAPTYEQHLLSDDTALGEFNRELQRGSVLKRIAFQDSMLAIRKAQEAIMKEVGVDRLNMAEDAYTAENRSHGKGKNEFEEYNNEFLQPLRKAYHQMKKVLGDSYDNVRIYMMAKHGLERDAQMAFKKSLEADYEDVAQRSAAYRAYKGDMNRMGNDSGFELGYIDFTTWRQRDNALRVKYSPSYMNYRYDKMGIAYDYSGLSALFDGSDFEEAAHKLIKDIESKYITETHNLWDATNAATKKILRDGYKAGMMSKDTYQYVRDMYSHYIPLRGWDGTTADQVWDYIGGGKGAFNQTLKTAHGRTSIADDPIAYIENMAESGILLNNKNWVKQHLMLLAQNHPTSLLTLSKAWYVKSTDANGNEEWIPATPQITSQMNSNQVKTAIDAFEKKMEQMAQTGDATQKRDGLNIAYPQTHSEEREHEVRVMKDGEEYVIYVNGDPQLAQAMNNTRAHRVREIQSGKLDRAAAWLGRKMAAAYTSLSPLFIPSNYFRDLTMTLASTAIREDGRYNYLLRKNLATSWNLGFMLRDYQNGKLREKVNNGNATPKEQMFYDFMMNGGETGFVSSLDVEDLKKKFKNDLKDLDRWKANPVKVGHTIMDGIEFLNRAIEDSNRFAVYMTSIQYGRSIDEAVNDAKDVTLNFNRKGTGEYGWQMIRNLYLFINPAVQSLQTLGALVKHHPFKFTAVTASWLASGVLVPIVNAALMSMLGGDDDKDKYWQFTKWDRRNNLIMWVPFTHEFVKIPLAQEFRAFYGLGDMIASKMMGGELAEESWSLYGEDLLGQVVDMLPLDPTGYDGNIAVSLMPNAIRPVFELAFNVDFTGKPLFKDTEYNKYDPNFTKAYVGTPDWLVRASKMVNSIGNDYPDVQQNSIDAFGDPRYNLNNPAVVDHVLSSYLGGAYTMGSQVLGVLTKSLNDPKEIKVADIPLFSKFVSNPDDRPVTKKQGDEFWDMKENHDRAANTLSKLKKQAKVDGDYSMLERFYGSEEYKQYKQDDVKVKKYEEDKKKERAEESGEEYRPHKLNAEDIYKAHATPKDDFEDLKLKQLYTKLNGFKTSYDLLVDTAPSQSDGYYNTNKAAIDAIDEISLDKQEISELKKGFLDDGKDAYNAEDMKQIRELRKKIISVLEKANKVVVANQKANAKKK